MILLVFLRHGLMSNDNRSDSELNIPGVNFYRKIEEINLKVKGEELPLNINENLVSRHHEVQPDKQWEAVWAKISLSKNAHLFVRVCYRSTNANTEKSTHLTKVIDTAADHCALIFGDFNYSSIDW